MISCDKYTVVEVPFILEAALTMGRGMGAGGSMRVGIGTVEQQVRLSCWQSSWQVLEVTDYSHEQNPKALACDPD